MLRAKKLQVVFFSVCELFALKKSFDKVQKDKRKKEECKKIKKERKNGILVLQEPRRKNKKKKAVESFFSLPDSPIPDQTRPVKLSFWR